MLQVEDQMKLLQNCWSELLILDFVFKQMSHSKLDQLKMVSMKAHAQFLHVVNECTSVHSY